MPPKEKQKTSLIFFSSQEKSVYFHWVCLFSPSSSAPPFVWHALPRCHLRQRVHFPQNQWPQGQSRCLRLARLPFQKDTRNVRAVSVVQTTYSPSRTFLPISPDYWSLNSILVCVLPAPRFFAVCLRWNKTATAVIYKLRIRAASTPNIRRKYTDISNMLFST